jgi:hypothetical protein
VIPSEDINVARDVAYCRECNLSSSLSQLTQGGELISGIDLSRPPAGAWSRNEGGDTIIGATHRSIGTALGALIFGLFWNGIVSVFVYAALVGTLQHLHISIPHRFPKLEKDADSMPLAMVIFLWIFLTPFILIGLTMIATFFSALFGRTEIRIGNSQGTLFVGIGPIGRRKRFDARDVKDVRLVDTPTRNSSSNTNIVIETREGKQIKFGSMLKDERKRFVAAAVSRAVR